MLKKMGQIKLEGDGLRCTVTFRRQPDVVAQQKRLAAFTLSAPVFHKNLTGSIEQMGQVTRVNLTDFDRRASGTLHFDEERGVLTDSALQADANGLMNFEGQGQPASMELKMEMDMQVNLLSQD